MIDIDCRVKDYLRDLQTSITGALAGASTASESFFVDEWQRPAGGGGRSMVSARRRRVRAGRRQFLRGVRRRTCRRRRPRTARARRARRFAPWACRW